MKKKRNKFLGYFIIILSILVVAIVGSILVNLGMGWYNILSKPTQFVPNILIPIMWTIIYITFAIILCMWWDKSAIPKSVIFWLVINACFNIVWCLLFFTLGYTFWGLVSIVLLLIMSYILVININKYNKTYSYFLSIYPIWVSIATTLNIALWILN